MATPTLLTVGNDTAWWEFPGHGEYPTLEQLRNVAEFAEAELQRALDVNMHASAAESYTRAAAAHNDTTLTALFDGPSRLQEATVDEAVRNSLRASRGATVRFCRIAAANAQAALAAVETTAW